MKPITLDIQARVVSLWSKLVSDEDHKLTTLVYKVKYHYGTHYLVKSLDVFKNSTKEYFISLKE